MSQSTRNMRSRSARSATLSALLCGVWLVSLAASVAHADYYDDAATDVCGCLKEPYAIAARALESMRTAQQTGDFSQMAKYQGEMMGVVNGSTRCFEGLSEKYPDIKASEDKQRLVMDRVEKQCPNPMKQLGMP